MITENLSKAVANSDLDLVRAIILREINSDRNAKEFVFIKSCKYVKDELARKGLSVFEEDNGESHFVEDKNRWTKELWQDLRIDFQHNFSEKKINSIVLVMQYLREQGHPDFQVRTSNNTLNSGIQKSKTSRTQENYRASGKTEQQGSSSVLIGAAVGGASGLVIGALAGKVIGFTLGGLVGGLLVGAVINQMQDQHHKG